jgi:hypothetical protein
MRKQVRFNEVQAKQLELFLSKVNVKNNLKYFDFVTKALETTNFEVALLKRTKYYGSEKDNTYKKF